MAVPDLTEGQGKNKKLLSFLKRQLVQICSDDVLKLIFVIPNDVPVDRKSVNSEIGWK